MEEGYMMHWACTISWYDWSRLGKAPLRKAQKWVESNWARRKKRHSGKENGMCKGPVSESTMVSAWSTSVARAGRVKGSVVPDRAGEEGKKKRLPAWSIEWMSIWVSEWASEWVRIPPASSLAIMKEYWFESQDCQVLIASLPQAFLGYGISLLPFPGFSSSSAMVTEEKGSLRWYCKVD